MRDTLDSTGKSYKFIFEEERYKCGVNSCNHHSRMANDFERHLQDEHKSIKKFRCLHCNEKIVHGDERNRIFNPVDIMRHLELHGNDQFTCCNCKKWFSSEFQVQLHLTRRHSSVEFKYHHRNVDVKGEPMISEDIVVMFECNICHQLIPTVALAMEHFKISHNGANTDLTATKVISRRTRNLDMMTIPVHRAFLLQQHLICGLCDSTFATKERLITHHWQIHNRKPIAIRFSSLMCFNNVMSNSLLEMTKMNTMFDRHILYGCLHCPETNFSQVNGVLAHWSKVHGKDDQLPFRYHALPLVSCKHCQTLSTFRDLIKHHTQKHPEQTFVAVNPANQKKCCICNFIGDNITDHFRREHLTVLQETIANPVCMNEDTINQLLEINIKNKFKCGRCDVIIETENDVKDHYLDEHKTLEFDHIEFNDNQSVQLIGSCCHLEIEQITFFEHLVNHERNFCCPKCSFHTGDSFKFMDHGIEAHDIHNDACTLDLKFMKSWFWHSEYIFGNGLVLNKHNLFGSSIDDSVRFKEFSETFVAEQEKKHYSKILI